MSCHIPVRKCGLLAALLSVVTPAAMAASGVATLDPTLVTASRTEQTLNGTLAAATVITRDDIDRRQPGSTRELLRATPGLSVTNSGGPGKATSMHLRGTAANHVLVMIDGLRVGSATSGATAIQDIPVDQIQRIEIVRGPFSSLYGSDAMGGVIQIFTRRPGGAFTPHASVGSGSHHQWRVNAGLAGRGANGWYSISAAHKRTDGIDAKRCKPTAAGGCAQAEPDRDGYRNSSLNLRGGYRFNDIWDGELRLFRTQGRNEYDGSTTDLAKTTQQVAGGRLRYQPLDDLSVTLNLGRTADLSDNYLHGRYQGFFDTHRDIGSLQADIGIHGGLLTVGYDWRRDRIDSRLAYGVDERINRALFAQWQQNFATQSVQASVRRDRNSQFGGKTTGSVLWGWQMTDALELTASYGTAYKAPTFNDLYFPGYGNAGLQPETSRSWELDLKGHHDWGHWSLNGFVTHLDHLISTDLATLTAANIDQARIRGVEATFDGTLAQWHWHVSTTWLDPVNTHPGVHNGNILPRRVRHSGQIDLDRRFGDFKVGAGVHLADARYNDLANSQRMGGYALANLRFGYRITPDLNLHLSVKNALDHDYETARYFNQPGRRYLLTLNYRPAP